MVRRQACTAPRAGQPSLNYIVSLLIDGFDSPPTFMMTYNPALLRWQFANYGFARPRTCLPSGVASDAAEGPRSQSGQSATEFFAICNVGWVRPLDKSHFREEVKTFLFTLFPIVQ